MNESRKIPASIEHVSSTTTNFDKTLTNNKRWRRLSVITSSLGTLLLLSARLVYNAAISGCTMHSVADRHLPDSCMSEVQRVRLSRRSCMMRVESL
jgi:hypothetical protein